MTIYAAGILFKSKDGRALFLKRGPSGDHAGEWCFPGGKIEGDETALIAASREATEETGTAPDKTPILLTRSISLAAPVVLAEATPGAVALPASGVAEAVDFTTFLAEIEDVFSPVPDDEHCGFAWAPISSPPEPLHPGCAIALERLSMNELDVARAMAAQRLTSPQVYKNVTLWDLRITGTGIAFRHAKKDKDGKEIRGEEFPFRDPAIYLNDEFLARCNGLIVVWTHPEKNMLDSKSFADSVVGSIMLPYIRDDAVWGIAKVYDDSANKFMTEEQFSTSPGVMLGDKNSPSVKFEMEDGSIILAEGAPTITDHLGIVPLGVWDKGGPPTGVRLDKEFEAMDSVFADSALDKLRNYSMRRVLKKAQGLARN